MKVIFLKNQQIKDVAAGYAVNFLLPKKLAVAATDKNIVNLKYSQKAVETVKHQTETADQQTVEKLSDRVVELKVAVGKNGKIHGSITKKEIAKELKILKTNLILDEPIKKIGDYEIGIKFGRFKGKIKLKIVGEQTS